MLSFFLEHFALVVAAMAGVLAARGRQIDLFGVLVLGAVTGLGGGSLRDMLLGEAPAWVKHSPPLITVLVTSVVTFFTARYFSIPAVLMRIADAHGLALYTILGTKKALSLGAAPLPAVGMGVITGVAGGLLRDIILREVPLVFKREEHLYATAAFAGAGLYIVLVRMNWLPEHWVMLCCIAIILITRLIAIRWRVGLPEFD
jgi:uncharacterized membrane protein YeiH